MCEPGTRDVRLELDSFMICWRSTMNQKSLRYRHTFLAEDPAVENESFKLGSMWMHVKKAPSKQSLKTPRSVIRGRLLVNDFSR
jgi:hypothetical protein